jgi:predicted AAA+ superfamily ATPase
MIQRITELETLLSEFPAVAIIGPRQVGKSTLTRQAHQFTSLEIVYLDMESESDRAVVENTEFFLKSVRDKLIIIDEVQFFPKIFNALRPEIDAHRVPGRFILTGSANPALVKGVSESLAGRIAYMPLYPLSLLEIQAEKITLQDHWLRGGFPDALLAKTDDGSYRWMNNFVQSFIHRDLQQLFDTNLSTKLASTLWTMLANNNGGLMVSENYARALGVTGPTVKKYIQFLEGAYVLRVLQPWFVNSNKRLVKTPKVYIKDSGMLHYFANVRKFDKLVTNVIVGSSWEGYVIEEICKQLPDYVVPYFYRTHHGAEIDLLLVVNNTPWMSIEIKHSLSPKVGIGFHQSIDEMQTKLNYIIYTGEQTYQTKEGYVVMGLMQFLSDEIQEKLKEV